MNKKVFLISIISLSLVLVALLSSATLSIAHDDNANACNIDADLQGTVTQNHATVTNHSSNQICEYQATLSVYDSPKEPETDGWIDAQTLIGSKTVPVPQGATIDITVDGTGPSCWRQSDLVRGTNVLTPPYYTNAMAVDVYSQTCTSISETPAPSEVPSASPSAEITETPTTAPTATPVSGDSSGSSNSSSGSNSSSNSDSSPQQTVAVALASTGNELYIYAIIFIGAMTLISGMVLKKIGK